MKIKAPFQIAYHSPKLRKGAIVFCYRLSKYFGDWGYWYRDTYGADIDFASAWTLR